MTNAHIWHKVTRIFREADDQVDPFIIVNWVAEGRPHELDGISPADWIHGGGDPERVVTAAYHATAGLAQ